MTGLAGADPDELDRLATAFEGFTRRLHDSCSSITGSVHNNPWRGQRADHFRHEWDRQFWPTINTIIGSLDNVQRLLHDNANEQRQASGEPAKSYDMGSFFGNLFKEAGKSIDGAIGEAREVIGSKQFTQVLGGLQVLSTVTGVLAMVPALQGLAVVSVAASALLLAGHAAQMANSGHWSVLKLAEDGLTVGLGAAAGGALGGRVMRATEINLVKHGSESFSTLPRVKQAVTLVRVANVGIAEANTTTSVVTDVTRGDFGHAAIDSMGFAAPLNFGGADQRLAEKVSDIQTVYDGVAASPGGGQAVLEEMGK